MFAVLKLRHTDGSVIFHGQGRGEINRRLRNSSVENVWNEETWKSEKELGRQHEDGS
jgi:hypothetical protein